jgi:Flp pilus assembly protein TadB
MSDSGVVAMIFHWRLPDLGLGLAVVIVVAVLVAASWYRRRRRRRR